jgi:hypothetical protein
MKRSLLVLFLSAIPKLIGAHILEPWSYQQMFDKADVVIIATFVSSKDTSEHTMLRDMTPPSKVIGVVSDFETRLTLKGAKNLKGFQLHHYRLDDVEYSNGPSLIDIKLGRKPTFVLFLIKEKDGRYAPVTGQTDPAALSVLELEGSVYQ